MRFNGSGFRGLGIRVQDDREILKGAVAVIVVAEDYFAGLGFYSGPGVREDLN